MILLIVKIAENKKEGDSIGRVLVIEFDDKDSSVFDEIMRALEKHPAFEKLKLNDEAVLSLPGLEIYPQSRKIYRNRREIHLTAKEYDLLSLLVANKGRVLTYEQIYNKVWGTDSLGNESKSIGYHICNLREKLFEASPEAPFTIRCVRDVGYCFELNDS